MVAGPGTTRNADNSKIMVVSTPKTGNTWVKYLLSYTYDLPLKALGMAFNAAEADALGSRWVAHQHFFPQPELVDWARRNRVSLVTTIRHPCDTLVSMFHYVRNLGHRLQFGESDRSPMMARDGDRIGEHTADYVREFFFAYLRISLDWMRSGKSLIVRYEDLKRDPVVALESLTAAICPVSRDRIQRAIDLCDIDRLRRMPGQDPRFFRRGSVGGWRSELPQQIIDIFRHTEPYPSQFAELGYSLDQDYPVTVMPNKRPASPTPGLAWSGLLEQVHATACVNPHLPIAWPTWPKGLWPKVEALTQKVMRRLLRWYINPIVEQQNHFNQAVTQTLEEMWQEIVELQRPPLPGQQERRSEKE